MTAVVVIGDSHAAAFRDAWALVGLGTVASIGRELDLLNDSQRRRLVAEIGRLILGASAA